VFGQTPAALAGLGREIEKRALYRLPSGKIRVVQLLIRTGPDQNMVMRTEEVTDVVPPLDCSCIPDRPHEIAECSRCLGVICRRHSRTCMSCGNVFCSGCLKRINIHGLSAIVCKPCADEIKTPKWLTFLKNLCWGK
jgi:hypothetical protein